MTDRTIRGDDAHGSAPPAKSAGRRFTRLLYRLLFEWVPALLMTVIVVVLCADVFGRYVLNSPIVWSSEVALVSFIWLVYLGAVDVAGRGGHIAVDVLTARLPQRTQAVVATITQLLILAVLSYLAYYGFIYFFEGRFTSLPGLDLSKRFVELAIPVASLALAVHALVDLLLALRGIATGRYTPRSDPDDFVAGETGDSNKVVASR